MESPSPVPRPNTLGGEEGFEQPRLRSFVHAAAVIAHRDLRVRSRLHRQVAPRVALVQLYVGRFNGQRAALRHGVARIHHQVHQHLFDLSRIRAHHSQVRPQRQLQIDILADQPPQHRGQARHQLIQVQHPGLQDLRPAVSQQLLGQRCRALAGLQDLLRRVMIRIARLQRVQDQLAVARDDGQQIIEIVRHAARQHAHRFHLLRLPQLRFQLPAHRHV